MGAAAVGGKSRGTETNASVPHAASFSAAVCTARAAPVLAFGDSGSAGGGAVPSRWATAATCWACETGSGSGSPHLDSGWVDVLEAEGVDDADGSGGGSDVLTGMVTGTTTAETDAGAAARPS